MTQKKENKIRLSRKEKIILEICLVIIAGCLLYMIGVQIGAALR